MHIPNNLAIPPIGRYPREMLSHVHKWAKQDYLQQLCVQGRGAGNNLQIY